MERYQSDYQEGNNQRNQQTRRSDRYRHPERDNDYQFDDYGSSARGGYGNESNSGTWGNQGNEMGGSRNVSNQDIYDTYSTSRNYGNMGSYGGAQGFGTPRGGYPQQRHYDSDTNFNFDSGMGSPREARNSHYSPGGYRAYQGDEVYGSDRGMGNTDNRELYGSDTSRRFQGDSQNRYDFDRDNNRRNSSNYGGAEGNYMGSGYDRSSRSEYSRDRDNYGSRDRYNRDARHSGYNDTPYGTNGYYSGGHGNSNSDSDYFKSDNRYRTFDWDRIRDKRRQNNSDQY
ncbi:hypothetical protein [Pontibacter harenae]|uniref:hypothetical protein n=1 Tax=Pontibacter harenae TaxID=2894083 RepID=UPI001E502299|nr:hypothetical protein [Pontibacter harenae]MCC9167512.1 hypothetical protein [Pontibacter harenae]